VNGVLFKSVFSYTDCLIEWAGCTMAFDELVIIMEVSISPALIIVLYSYTDHNTAQLQQDAENIPSPNLDIFFTTIASLRSQHGVPISLIIMNCTPGGLGDRLSSLRRPAFYGGSGDGGVMQKVLRMPLPEDQLGEFEMLLMLTCAALCSQHMNHDCTHFLLDRTLRE
jgi:hypothetical protein